LLLCCYLIQAIVEVNFPNYIGNDLDIYSGYVTVNELSGRTIHYVLVRAETNPDTKPLIVWYQGGPGCSGLFALFGENGPLRVVRSAPGQTSVLYNQLGWTQFANMLYVEQPAFVGFSYSNNQSDMYTGDYKAAADNYMFLQLFMKTQFPEFAGRDLWFTGESYGGIYVPMLSNYVTSDNTTMLYKTFKGFMIGNPVFNCQGGMIGQGGAYFSDDVNNLYWHGLVSYTNYYNWTSMGCNDPTKALGMACQWIYNKIIDQIGYIDQEKRQTPMPWPSVDPDDLFQDFCSGNGTLDFINSPMMDDPNNPCDYEVGDLIVEYLNREDVQYSLAVPPIQWEVCSPLQYTFAALNMVTYYQNILRNKPSVRILVYSGDLDILTVPLGYTLPCLGQISPNIVSAWQPWFVNGVTAGYVETYDRFTYATLKGAGHEAPLYQPISSFQMIYRFLMNGNLNDSLPPRVKNQKPFRRQSDMFRYYGIRNR